jgi:hypothetical protein
MKSMADHLHTELEGEARERAVRDEVYDINAASCYTIQIGLLYNMIINQSWQNVQTLD